MEITWNVGSRNGTSRHDFLDEPHTSLAIEKLEAAAGVKGDWEWDDETGWNWWGLVGDYGGHTFTLYTHKSGRIKIGAFSGSGLDLEGLKAALHRIIGV